MTQINLDLNPKKVLVLLAIPAVVAGVLYFKNPFSEQPLSCSASETIEPLRRSVVDHFVPFLEDAKNLEISKLVKVSAYQTIDINKLGNLTCSANIQLPLKSDQSETMNNTSTILITYTVTLGDDKNMLWVKVIN